ncbi:MAG: terminase large subunit domain-containing protein, partial [Acidimicrobiales bacterium]
ARLRTVRQCPTPIDLATRFDLTIRRTPALDLVNARLRETVTTRNGRLVVSVPPQEFKTTTLRWLCAHTLIDQPEARLVYASYGAGLARGSGRTVRGLIGTHGLKWGLAVDRGHADASDWQLQDHAGGMFTCGIGGSLTGKPADGMVIDDPLRGQKDADSETVLRGLHEWWSSVARTRLAPGAWVIVVQTRWVEDDLAGRLGKAGWPVINIPALADGRAPDALKRPVGEFLQSTRDRTADDWRSIRKDVGERVWAALYQGVPSPPAGGIFLGEWFERDRVDARPTAGLPPVIVVDPADNTGAGDEAGILVASSDTAGHIYLGPDYSQNCTTGRWVRIALLAAVRHKAGSLAYEKSLSGLDRSVRDGWARLYKQAKALRRHHPKVWPEQPDLDTITAVTTELCHPDDPDTTRQETQTELLELWPLTVATLVLPDTGVLVRRITPQGSKQLRAQLAAPVYQNRRVSHIGHLAALEHQMETWQVGQDSPDRMDTAVHAVMLLSGMTTATLSRPQGTLPTRSTRQSGRSSTLPRSTRR